MLRAFDDAYYPSLSVRPAEMEALKELPEKDKDSIFPIIKFGPWTTAKKLSSAVDKINNVYGGRPVICDVDYDYPFESTREAVEEFKQIVDTDNHASNWISFLNDQKNFIPTVMCREFDAEHIQNQIESFISFERGFAFRFELNTFKKYRFDQIKSALRNALNKCTIDDFCVIIDAGVINNVNLSELQIVTAVKHFEEFENLRIIICSSSFPNAFQKYSGVDNIEILSRQLFANVKRRYNNIELSYSDWGSTKPRSKQKGGGVPIPRIDYPMANNWIVSRNKDESWSYETAAKKLIASPHWKNSPNIWGVQKIRDTAEGSSAGINNARRNTSSRINIHLFIQNHFGSDAGAITTDEPWVDL